MDVQAVRSQFPALINNPEYIFCENAGGSQVLKSVPESITSYMLETNVQMANYALAATAAGKVANGSAAGAIFSGADSPDDVMFGGSATQLAETLSRMIEASVLKQRSGEKVGDGSEPVWKEEDEIILSDADHEANRGAWIRLAARTGLKIVDWPVTPLSSTSNRYSVGLDLKVLSTLITSRTRLVALTACSNVLGGVVPIKEVSEIVKQKSNAWVAVDAVAFAPHQGLSPKEWGADFVLWSWYKVYGPHVGSLYVSPKAKSQLLTKLNHHFITNDDHYTGMYSYQPSSQQYELIASISSVMEYFFWLGSADYSTTKPKSIDWSSLFKPDNKEELSKVRKQVQVAFKRMSEHEAKLLKTLITFLNSRNDRIKIVGSESDDHSVRVPTVAFVVVDEQGKTSERSAKFHQEIVKSGKLGFQQGHMYAYRLITSIGLSDSDGVVRVSLLHYNTVEEVEQLGRAIDDALHKI